jgi:uncharacterized protein YaiL (DUF2058 family)
MSNSLKDQLMGLGFKDKPIKPVSHQAKVNPKKSAHRNSTVPEKQHTKTSDEIDLAKAFALRQKDEQRLREQAEREKHEKARLRKVAKEQVGQLLKDQVLNVAEADIVRHFPYGGKIKRVYVTSEQLKAVNSGELAIVQNMGKFCIVPTVIAMQVKLLSPSLVALHCDGSEEVVAEDYASSQFAVPDDLIW